MNYFKGILLFLFMSVLFSCSGDDSDVNPDPTEPEEPTVVTGVFIDSEVTGLHYSTETQSGVTNSEGEYNYIEGETVTFSVGEITLGSAPAGPELSPVSIATTPDASVHTEEVKNIAALLQTLDTDNDPSNGILIEAATIEAINISSIDFTQPIIKILGEVVAEVNLINDSNLSVVYPETAAEHLAGTLGETYNSDDPVFENFIPYLENRYGRTSFNSHYWVHETDEDGELIHSQLYEKYPHRPVFIIRYLNYNDKGLPVSLERYPYDFDGNEQANGMEADIYYSEEGIPERSIWRYHGNNNWVYSWYKEFDDLGRVEELNYSHSTTPDPEPSATVQYSYDEEGNRVESITYNINNGTESNRIVYSYTSWGDFEKQSQYNSSGNEVARYEYFYRSDRTLEKIVYTDLTTGRTVELDKDENEMDV